VTTTRYLCISEEQASAARAAQPSHKEIEDAARRFALLGDPNRIRIAIVLREIGELCVGDTAKVLGLKISLVSHHVRAFASHDLAEKRRDGKLVRYRLTDAALELLDHAFERQADLAGTHDIARVP
jgi:DNA-binding transcriptional ArsR family regulator